MLIEVLSIVQLFHFSAAAKWLAWARQRRLIYEMGEEDGGVDAAAEEAGKSGNIEMMIYMLSRLDAY